jgi:hypothetical protein
MRTRILVATASLFTLGLLHCGSNAAAPGPGEGASGADGGDAVVLPPPPPPPENCDGTATPRATLCVVHEAYGVFVSASKGSDSGDGSRAHPLKSISKAIQGALPSGRRVYACAETYDEVLTFGDGIDIYAYFDCKGDWVPGSGRALIAPSTEVIASRAKNVVKPTFVEALDIRGRLATEPGQSSIGLLAEGSKGLSFASVRIVAGQARSGSRGAAAIQLTESQKASGNDGNAAASCSQAGTDLFVCETQRTLPASGGTSRCVGADGFNGGPGGQGGISARYELREQRAGDPAGSCPRVNGMATFCYFLVPGYAPADGDNRGLSPAPAAGATPSTMAQPGAAGAAGSDGANGAWQISATGFSPGDGTAGTHGAPGQGGGGGTGERLYYNSHQGIHDLWGGRGAGGGAGGCPGLAGGAGGGGGASIAVIAIQSPMKFDINSEIIASAGGAGGSGAAPSNARSGGSAGYSPSSNPEYTAGAPGGAGGAGGYSGHGASGPSIGIAYRGPKPNAYATPKTAPAAPGLPAVGPIPATAPGLSAPTFAF